MRVRCIDNVDETRSRYLADGRRVEEYFPFLTVGKVYTVSKSKHDDKIVYVIVDDGKEVPFRWNRFCVVNDPTPVRLARVVDDRRCSHIKNGDVFEILEEVYEAGHTRDNGSVWAKQFCYVITNRVGRRQGYEAWRFVVQSDDSLPSGWRYCRCGTTTSNSDLCCDCKSKS